MPNQFYLDASALAKRYVVEIGTPLLNHLFLRVPPSRLMCLFLGTLEVVSIFVRKRNGNRIPTTVFNQALTDFQREVLGATAFRKLSLTDALTINAVGFIIQYSINSNDAIVLRSALDNQAQLIRTGDSLALISSDQRLLRAAQAEGLAIFNPETQSQADLDAFIGP